jgi:hypothetical protein
MFRCRQYRRVATGAQQLGGLGDGKQLGLGADGVIGHG